MDALKLHPIIRDNHIWLHGYHEVQNKHVKIVNYLGEMWQDIEWAEETQPEYLEQIVDYREKEEPDDAPDSAAALLREGNFSITRNLGILYFGYSY